MTVEEESSRAWSHLLEAKAILERYEDAGGGSIPATGNVCHQAYQAARIAVQALCQHYNQEYTEETSLEDMLGMLSPSYLRVPLEVQQATTLSRYNQMSAANSSGDDCTEAIAQAQNVVSWVEVLMAAGKPFIVG